MLRRDEVKSKVKVINLIAGDPFQLTVAQCAVRPDGRQRSITQKVHVPDTQLALRLTSEVNQGDEIEVTIVTDWIDSGYSTYLSDYRPVSTGSKALAEHLPIMMPSS